MKNKHKSLPCKLHIVGGIYCVSCAAYSIIANAGLASIIISNVSAIVMLFLCTRAIKEKLRVKKILSSIIVDVIKNKGKSCKHNGEDCTCCFLVNKCPITYFRLAVPPPFTPEKYNTRSEEEVYKEAVDIYLKKHKKEDALELLI